MLVPRLRFFLLLNLPLICLNSALAQPPQNAATARITTTINESSLVTLRGNVHPLVQASVDNGPAPISMPASRMILVLTRSTQQEADLETYLQSVQDKNSPNFHKFLSPVDFGKRFGVGDADLQAVQAWLTGNGFTVNKVSSGRTAIEFSGTVGQVQSAFHISIHGYTNHGQTFWASAADPQVPSALAPVLAGIASLNSLKPRAQFIRGPSGRYDAQTHTISPTYTIGDTVNGYNMFVIPADAATIYDTPTTLNANLSGTAYDGSGVTIGIAGDSNINLTQNANFRATFGLPAKATTVVVDGVDPGENGDAIEAYLDTQVAGGIAPNANVILYTASDTAYQAGLYLAIMRALDDNQADILNVSFGNCEAAFGTAGNQLINSFWEQAAAQGIAVTVSSGDSGSAGCDNPNTETVAVNGLGVNGLGSTPYNISVGGTDYDALYSNFPTSFTNYVDVTNTLPNHRSALRYIPEEPWNDSTFPNTSILQNIPLSVAARTSTADNIVAGGGGVSKVYATPGWQNGFGSSSGRSLPDVSFLAGNGLYGAGWGICTDLDTDAKGSPVADCAAGATGNSFNLTGIGGTSAAAPAFAGMLALLEQKVGSRLGQADYGLYHLAKNKPAAFNDVVTGDNSVACTAGTPNCQAVTAVNTTFLSGYNATVGYDEATGLGSVDAALMTGNWGATSFTATNSSLQLNGATTALSITHGQSVQVNATVAGSSGTPSGALALVDNLSPASRPNAESIASFALASGNVSGTTTSFPGGSYQVSAHYGGDSTFAQSDSNAISVTVAPESSTTTLKVAGYYDPSTGKAATTPYYGFIYLIDAQPYGNSASAATPNGAATGTITFKNGTATLGTAALSSEGLAELQTTTLPGGNNSLTAVFPGDASFSASTSAALIQAVQPAPNVLNLTTDKPTYNVGDTVALTVAFSSSTSSAILDSLGAAPTGTVTFFNGTTALGTVNVNGTPGTATGFATASATLMTSKLNGGNNLVTATYSGDGNYATSSTPSYIYVYLTPAATKMTFVPAASAIKIDQPLLLTTTMPASGTLPIPTGTVVFSVLDQAMLPVWTSPSVSVTNGSATATIPANSLKLGALIIWASYSGDSIYFGASVSAPLQVNSTGSITPVMKLTLPLTPTSGALPVTVTVSGPGGDPIPTGSIMISSSFLSWPLVNGSVSFTTYASLQPGPNVISASYLGDSTYAPATASGTVTGMGTGYLTFSPPNPTISQSTALNLTVSVGSVTNLPPPTGTIALQCGSYSSQATSLVSGVATITIPANTLSIGTDNLIATYSGDANYIPNSGHEPVFVIADPPGLTLTGTNASVARGATTGNTSTITLTPSGGFTGSVAMTASVTSSPAGAQYLPTLSFGSTSPVSITGAAAASATLTINTTAATAALTRPKLFGDRWTVTGGAALACLMLFGIPARRRRWRSILGLAAFLVALAGGVMACGGGGGSSGGGGGTAIAGTTAGTYTITVTGTSGAVSGSGTVTLTVQ